MDGCSVGDLWQEWSTDSIDPKGNVPAAASGIYPSGRGEGSVVNGRQGGRGAIDCSGRLTVRELCF